MERNVKMKIEVEENVVITQDSMSNLEKDEEKKLTVDNQDNLHENHKYAWEKYYLDTFDFLIVTMGIIIVFWMWDIILSTPKSDLTSNFLSIFWVFSWGVWWARFEKYTKAHRLDQALLISPFVILVIYFCVWYQYQELLKANELAGKIFYTVFPWFWFWITSIIWIYRYISNKKQIKIS